MANPVLILSPEDQNPSSNFYTSEFDSLQIPPLDSILFSDADNDDNNCLHIPPGEPFIFGSDELGFEDNVDYELTIDDLDDLYFPSEAENFLIPDNSQDSLPDYLVKDIIEIDADVGIQVSESRVLDSDSNFPSPENDQELSGGPASSQGSGSGNSGSDAMNYPSPDTEYCDVIVDQKIKPEEVGKSCKTKRKKEPNEGNMDSRSVKYRKASVSAESTDSPLCFNAGDEEDEKKKARLMRNRESAQLSRQRKKHYVEELEDKVRTMHSTIAELNSKISYFMAENAGLRQQLSGGAMCQPPPGMYPHPAMAPMNYPWMPCAPYVVKPQGSQVPLVPIPRLKPQKPAPVVKAKKNEGKKSEGKTKKVASVSFLGVLFFFMLFGGLVPMVNVKFGNVGDRVSSKLAFVGNRLYNSNRGRVLRVDGYSNLSNGVNVGASCGKSDNLNVLQCDRGYMKGQELKFDQRGRGSQHSPDSDESTRLVNASEPLVASLYVPRNDKLVKIDGNLIIHSFLASEKTIATHKASDIANSRETGLAIPRDLSPPLAIPEIRGNGGKHSNIYRKPSEQSKALTSGPAHSLKDHIKATSADGKLQQWFREGLAGPMLSSGVCTEVFQFDVSSTSPGAIISASSISKTSEARRKNATHLNMGRNRRILRGLPVPLVATNFNITEEPVRNSRKDSFQGNKTASSMVVSVLMDPREAGDSEVDSMITPKSLSRIFVVVLLDSVKYVTYSCVLPRSGPHLVSA